MAPVLEIEPAAVPDRISFISENPIFKNLVQYIIHTGRRQAVKNFRTVLPAANLEDRSGKAASGGDPCADPIALAWQ
jgi:hypothetical protein